LLLNAVVHAADIQDRDGAALVLNKRTRRRFPFLQKVFADTGYRGEAAQEKLAETGPWNLEIMEKAQGPGRLRRPAQALDRGANPGLDQPQPPPGQGFRDTRPKKPRPYPPRHEQDHATPLE
jgi:hypothetical protein